MISLPALPLRRLAAALAGFLLLAAGCGGGENEAILVPTVKASISQGPPPVSDAVVFFQIVSAVGDTIQLNAVVSDSTGTLDLDDADLVLRYDATFIQVINVTAQDAIFGTCNTVNPACALNSPICADNRVEANGGGESYCRSNGSTACVTDDDCTAAGDKCGSFGRLLASQAVLTGPEVCTNDPDRSCATDSDCQLCNDPDNTTLLCTGAADCSGACGLNNLCTKIPTRSCVSDGDCYDECSFGVCQGCPSVVVSGTRKIASLTLRVMEEGAGTFRFVVSTNPGTTGSALRKDLVDQPVLFFPNVDGDDPSSLSGEILITGTL